MRDLIALRDTGPGRVVRLTEGKIYREYRESVYHRPCFSDDVNKLWYVSDIFLSQGLMKELESWDNS